MPAIPNRSEDLARPRERKGGTVNPVTKGEMFPVTIPEPDPNWHPIAYGIYESFRTSGQSAYMQDTDWWLLWSVCEDMSMYKNPSVNRDGEEYHKRSGQMLDVIMRALGSLLATEGDRRRVRIELQAPEPTIEPVHLKAVRDAKRLLGHSI